MKRLLDLILVVAWIYIASDYFFTKRVADPNFVALLCVCLAVHNFNNFLKG